MRICQKDNCNGIAIPRGKYCEDHRTNKKKIVMRGPEPRFNGFEETKTDIAEIRLKQQEEKSIEDEIKKLQLEEDRLLRQDQEFEYQETMRKDMERIKQEKDKEYKKQLLKEDEELQQAIFLSEIESKRSLIPKDQDDNGYNIKFNIPKKPCVIHNFHGKSSFRNVFNFLDVYFHDNKIPITNYNIVVGYPKKIYTLSESDIMLCDANLPKNVTLFLQDLDS